MRYVVPFVVQWPGTLIAVNTRGRRKVRSASREGLRNYRGTRARQAMRCGRGSGRRRQGNHEGLQWLARARRRALGGSTSRRALRNFPLRYVEDLGGEA